MAPIYYWYLCLASNDLTRNDRFEMSKTYKDTKCDVFQKEHANSIRTNFNFEK